MLGLHKFTGVQFPMKPHALPLIVERCDARLKQMGMTRQGALAAAGVGVEHIARLEKGFQPRLDTLDGIAVALGWSLGQLLGYMPTDLGTMTGNLNGELDRNMLEIALRVARKIATLLPIDPQADPATVDAELTTVAYGTLFDLAGSGVPSGALEAAALVSLRRWASASASSKSVAV